MRHAVRSLLARPGLSAAAIVSLGLAMGASATIFGVVDALWLRPPGVACSQEIVRIFGVTDDSGEGNWSYPELLDLEARLTSVSHVTGRGQRGTLVPDSAGMPTVVLVNVVPDNFFEAMGVRPAHGRLPGAGDTGPVVALGHAYWMIRFGGDTGVVGRTLPLGGSALPATIVGVLPASFRDLDPAGDRELWMPTGTWAHLAGEGELRDREFRWFTVVARRAAGQTPDEVAAEVAVVVPSLATRPGETPRRARVVTDLAYRLDNAGANGLALVALVAVVCLITCVNLTELLMAGVACRERELATRVALGASKRRLIGALLVEGAWLGLGGLLVGTVVTMALMRLVPWLIVAPPGFRSPLVVTLDGRVVLVLLGMAMLSTVAFSIAPARLAARTDLLPIIKGESATRPSSRVRVPMGLVLQVALAFVLLSAAALLARSFVVSQSSRFGLTRSAVLTAWVLSDLPPPRRAEVEARLAAVPGVTRVATAIRAPLSLSGGGRALPMRLPGSADAVGVKYNAVSADYFAVIGTAIVDGRAISRDDERAGRHTMVVSRALAARWPAGAAVVGAVVGVGADRQPWQVVGIADDAAINVIGEASEPYAYLSFDAVGAGEATLLVSLGDEAAPPVREVRGVLTDVSASLEPRRMVMLGDYVAYATSDYRALAALAGALASLGLVLTLLGVYGVTAYRTSRRTREFGIRSALGAQRRQVLGEVLGEAGRVVGLGIALGGVVSIWGHRLIASLLLGVTHRDPVSLGVTAAVLGVGAVAAALGPALRAASLNPIDALRDG